MKSTYKMTKTEADIQLLTAVNAVNNVSEMHNGVYGNNLKSLWKHLNEVAVRNYKEAHNLPNDFWLEECVKHYNARYS